MKPVMLTLALFVAAVFAAAAAAMPGPADSHASRVQQPAPALRALPAVVRHATLPTVQNCSDEVKAKVLEAVETAYHALIVARDYVNNFDQCDMDDRNDFYEFFGTYDPNETPVQVLLVQGIIQPAAYNMGDGDFTIECGGFLCDSNPDMYAYGVGVYPGGRINLCPKGQNTSTTLSEDSLPGTLVAAITQIASQGTRTREIERGADECRDLSRNNPTSTWVNSDSYRYFVEFQPSCKGQTTPSPAPGTTTAPSTAPNESPTASPGPACFPAHATVQLRDGSVKRMDQLTLGDHIHVAANEFSELIMWSHRDANALSDDFVEIQLASGRKVTATRDHLMHANGKLVPASDVKPGDLMVDVVRGVSSVESVRHSVRARGLFNPHTASGDLVVDGVLVSAYTTAIPPRVAHTLLAIERLLNKALGLSLMGSSLEPSTGPLRWFYAHATA